MKTRQGKREKAIKQAKWKSFKVWKAACGRCILDIAGMFADDLPGYDYYADYAANESPAYAALAAIAKATELVEIVA